MFGLRDPGGEATELPHERLLARQLRVHSGLRYGVAALICGGAAFAHWVVGIENLQHPRLIGVGIALALVNTVIVYAIHRIVSGGVSDPTSKRQALLILRHTTIVADYLALAFLIELVGGARSPFMAVFLLHIVLGSIMVSRRAAWLYTGFAVALVAALVLGEWGGILHPVMPTGAIISDAPLPTRYATVLVASYAFLFAVTTLLMTRLADSLRAVERELIAAKHQVERLSEARRDFLHVALHNLKSPIAAASMLLENVRSGLAGPVNEKQEELIRRSLARLEESLEFTRDLNRLAHLEAAELNAIAEPVELDTLLEHVVLEHRDLAAQRLQTLELATSPRSLTIIGSGRLLHEAVVNLVTNAIKFTPHDGTITVGVGVAEEDVHIWVRDTGPGIPKHQQARLFGEFARLGTTLPNGEKPTGTGLGLSIVARIAQAHGGRVAVSSEPGRGATFSLFFPLGARGTTDLKLHSL